jgi:hypothetical protein
MAQAEAVRVGPEFLRVCPESSKRTQSAPLTQSLEPAEILTFRPGPIEGARLNGESIAR